MAIGLDPPVAARDGSPFAALLPALARLDERLQRAFASARDAFGADALTDRFRGLCITEHDVERLLARQPGFGAFDCEAPDVDGPDAPAGGETPMAPGSRLHWLARTYALDGFDVEILVIALAPELDLRYERLYAFLQDDVARRRPTVDLALTLLCDSAAERAERRAHFAVSAPLVRHGLLRMGGGVAGAQSLLAEPLEPDESITDFLLGHDLLDRRLADVCRYEPFTGGEPASGVLDDTSFDTLARVVTDAHDAGVPVRLRFVGLAGSGRRRTAHALARRALAPVLHVDAARLQGTDTEAYFRLALRNARLLGAITIVADAERLTPPMIDALEEHPGVVVLCGCCGGSMVGANDAMVVRFGIPALERRRLLWRESLARRGVHPTADAIDQLSARFRMTARQIDGAAAQVHGARRWRARHASSEGDGTEMDMLFAAARAQCGSELEALAARGSPRHRWDDLVLPEDALEQLREICERVAHRDLVVEGWGFGERLAHGGVNALFSGPSGTGKTMAAEVMAGALGVDLFRVDLAGVVSKYIGETEKNLDRVFAAAEHANGIIFFDEADALFGKRSEVHDSHDRYANIEISYLLQKMERFDGLAILATNLRNNLDDAFIRRLSFAVHFPFPDAEHRERIWRGIWPATAPVDPALDIAMLAQRFALSGGHIKNIALAAAFRAAQNGGRIGMRDVMHATAREYQKLGRSLSPAELAPSSEPRV